MPVSTVSIPVGQWLVSAEGMRWWFDSGSFALDFAYTGAIGDAARARAAARPRRPHHVAARAVPRRGGRRPVARPLRRGRAARRDRAHGRRPPRTASRSRSADIDLVNLYAATPDIPPALVGGSRQAGRSVQTVGAGALDDRTRRGRPLRPRERRPHPRVQRRRLRDRLPRHVARGHPPVVLDAALRQPREGACAPGPQGGAGGGLTDAARPLRRQARKTPSRSSGTDARHVALASRTARRRRKPCSTSSTALPDAPMRCVVACRSPSKAAHATAASGDVWSMPSPTRASTIAPAASWSSIANRIASLPSAPARSRARPRRRSPRSCARHAPPAGRGSARRPPCGCAGRPRARRRHARRAPRRSRRRSATGAPPVRRARRRPPRR